MTIGDRLDANEDAHVMTILRRASFLPAIGGLACSLVLASCANMATRSGPIRHVTQGPATTVISTELNTGCQAPLQYPLQRKTGLGRITATDGTLITVPAQTAIGSQPQPAPLYNECELTKPARLADVGLSKAPVVEVDPDGEVVTGFVVADNYFEIYVNGKLIAVDPTPYTPFNSAIVRFRAKKPYTYAVKLVDWEEKLGLGMEWFPPNHKWWPGDGGFIAKFSDGVVTDSSWRAQSFYIAPLSSPTDVIEQGNLHNTAALGRTHPLSKMPSCEDKCYAVHYPVPAGWEQPRFDDRPWPEAFTFTDEQVGISPALVSYSQFRDAFTGAQWIWSQNLVFDNLVLVRKTVR